MEIMSTLRAEDVVIKNVTFQDNQIILTMTHDSVEKLFEMINTSNSAKGLCLVLGKNSYIDSEWFEIGSEKQYYQNTKVFRYRANISKVDLNPPICIQFMTGLTGSYGIVDIRLGNNWVRLEKRYSVIIKGNEIILK